MAFFVLAACTDQDRNLVTPGIQSVEGAYTVRTPISWSRLPVPGGTGILWTVDGPMLEQLRLYAGLVSGQTLGKMVSYESVPSFAPGMTAKEVASVVLDTARARGAIDLEMHDLRSAPFGTLTGFRFEYSFHAGLPVRGIARGALQDGLLYLITFEAPAGYYFDQYAPAAESVIPALRRHVGAAPLDGFHVSSWFQRRYSATTHTSRNPPGSPCPSTFSICVSKCTNTSFRPKTGRSQGRMPEAAVP